MKAKRILCLIGLACACLIGTTKQSRAQIQSTLSGDSAQYRYWCGDSTGSPRACDSAWWYLTRINPATGAEVFVDSGRTTSPTAVFGGAFPRYRISDAQFTSLTAGRYILDIIGWGGTFGSQKLTTPVSHYFSAGLDSSAIISQSLADNVVSAPKIAASAITSSEAPNLDAAITSRLAPTVAARTLDVSSTGEAGVDWANVGTPGSLVSLSNTTIGTLTTNADKTGYTLSGTQTFNNTGTWTGNLTGSVGSVTGAVGSVTNEVRVNSIDTLRHVISVDTARTIRGLDANAIGAGDVAAGALTQTEFNPDYSTYDPTTDSTIVDGSSFKTLKQVIDTNSLHPNVKRGLLGILDFGTASAVTATSITLNTTTIPGATDSMRGAWVTITSATTGVGQTRMIAKYTSGTGVADITPAWALTPTGTITYVVWYGFGGLSAELIYPDAIGASEIADGAGQEIANWVNDSVWLASFNDYDNVAGSFGDSAQGWGAGGGGSGCAGSGAYVCSVYVNDSGSTTGISGTNVSIWNGTTLVAGPLFTTATGKLAFQLDNGTYAIRAFNVGYRYTTNVDTVLTVSGANTKDTTYLKAVTLPAAPAGGFVSITGNIYDITGDSLQGATVTLTLNQLCWFSSDDTTNLVAVMQERSVTTDINGDFTISPYPTDKLLGADRRLAPKYAVTVVLPDGQTTWYTDFVWTFSSSPSSQKLNWNLHKWKSE